MPWAEGGVILRGMALRSALLSLLLAAGPARALEGDFLVCRHRVDCAAGPTDTVPKSSFLIAFQDADFTGPFAWVAAEKPRVIEGVNKLLRHYGFPVTASEISRARFDELRRRPDADVVLKYRGNSFLGVVGVEGLSAHIGGTSINDVESYPGMGISLYGPTRHPGQRVADSDLEVVEVRPVAQMADPATDAARKRAMLAWTLTHEFVHAAQHRMLGTIASGDPAEAMTPRCVVPYKPAFEKTSELVNALAVSRRSGHMETGLMVAGGDHRGHRDDTHGGGTHSINNCLKDPRIPAALINDLAALAESDRLCGPRDEEVQGYPASDYFRLPAFNRAAVARYLTKMAGVSCYAGCFYEVLGPEKAMKAVGYDPAAERTFAAQGRAARAGAAAAGRRGPRAVVGEGQPALPRGRARRAALTRPPAAILYWEPMRVNAAVAANLERCAASFRAGSPIVAGLPHQVRLEITNDCNLFCSYSETTKKHGGCSQWLAKKPIGHMNPALFRRLIDELGPTMTQLFPYNFGEPFMNPDAASLIAYARARNADMRVDVHTNGHYFRTDEQRRAVVEAGIDELTFSIDGLTQETYQAYRLKGDLSVALAGLAGVAEWRRRLGRDTPRLIFQFIGFDHNVHELPRVRDFALERGADEAALKINLPHVLARARELHPGRDWALSGDSEVNFAPAEGVCSFPWNHTTVLADGRVVACCRDAMIEAPLGSVAEASLESVWNGPAYARYRLRYLEDVELPGACRACPAAPKTPPRPMLR